MNDIISQQIDKWVSASLPPKFEFRPHQKEEIIAVIENIVSSRKNHNHVIEAPTGSGKSIIAIVSAGVLATFYNLKSYILCSDLYLYDQYVDFIKKNKLNEYGYIKGQSGNYKCDVNNEDMKNAYCRMCGVSWASLFNWPKAQANGFACAGTCEYVRDRKKALASPVVVMTYQLFLYSVNGISAESDSHNTFSNRPVIFCDECHNIPEIVQGKMSLSIESSDFIKIYKLYDYMQQANMNLFSEENYEVLEKYKTYNELVDACEKLFVRFTDTKTNTEIDWQVLKDYGEMLFMFADVVTKLQTDFSEMKDQHKAFNKHDIELYKAATFLQNTICHYEDFTRAVAEAGSEYLLKQVNDVWDNDIMKKVVLFNCTKEDWMIYKYLLSQADWKVMFSATVGGKDAFEENNGLKYTEDKCCIFDMIPSTFSFDKSPVIFLNRYKMSYNEKQRSFDALKPIIYNTIKKFEGQRGIIQTGSYDLAKQIVFYAPTELKSRLVLYGSAKEKNKAIEKHRKVQDSVLVGPTLCEGIDLPDDLCRFIIIMKMPYPNMKDALVGAKMKLFPLWYNAKTSNAIIQGIGRGVRNADDYCVTYIYDACFYNLYINTKEQYSQELQDRIKIYS